MARKNLPFSFANSVADVVVVVTVGVNDGDDNFDVVDDIVELMLPVGVGTLAGRTASAHTSIGDGCVSFARFSSVGFPSTRGSVHMDGFEPSSAGGVSVLNALVVVECTVVVAVVVVVAAVVVVLVSREFECSADVVDTSGGVHMELDV